MNINISNNSLKIEVPSQKDWLVIIFLSLWTIGWLFAEINAISNLKNVEHFKDLFYWFFPWTLFGIIAICILLWNIFVKENVIVNDKTFQINRLLFKKVIFSRNFKVDLIRNLEYNPYGFTTALEQMQHGGLKRSYKRLQFEYKNSTIKFGVRVDDDDAGMIIDEIIKSGFIKQ